MSDRQNNVQITWQFVSQFVSWEFCRYMSEHNENSAPETDVLTFLRNMIVERTEKSISEVTKHEIIAKFIMEIKAVKNSEISSIIPLSENVKRICPEVEPAVNKLIHHLETFFDVIDFTDEDRKEIIRGRIEDSITDFSKEASRLLPQPKLLEVIDSWHNEHGSTLPRTIKKIIYNAAMFEKVLGCLAIEKITPSEAKFIAVALAEDKVFEKIMQNAEEEDEEGDSERFTLSQSSQPNENIYSQEFEKNSLAEQRDRFALNLRLTNRKTHNRVTPNAFPVQVPDKTAEVPDVIEFPQPNDSPPLVSPPSQSPPAYPLIHRNVSKRKENVELQNNESHNHMQFAQSSENESDEHESNLHDHIHAKLQEIYKNQRIRNQQDSDTSDCEKNPEFRFLTPTYFKRDAKKKKPQDPPVIWISDNESNNSSVITTPPNSQRNDPNWSFKQTLLLPAMEKAPRKKTVPSKKAVPSKKTVALKKTAPPKKKVGRLYSSSDSDEEPINSRIPFGSPRPSTSAARSDIELERPTKKRRVGKQLYRSPNVSIDDFIHTIRRPSPVTLSEVPVHQGTNTRSTKKPPTESSSSSRSKKQKCKQCTKSFKTAIALRRHVFLQHSVPPEDSDCDP